MPTSLYDHITVLVVDDNQHMRAILVSVLRAIGIKSIIEASDGADGLTHLQTREVDLVLADMNMNPLDGIEFVQLLRRGSDSRNRTVPVVMITGHTERHKVEQARDAGVNEFVAKPISAKVLVARISAALTSSRMFVNTARFVGPDRRRRVDISLDNEGPQRRATDT